MTGFQKIIIAFLGILASALVVAIVSVGWQVYQGWANEPLGAALPTSPYTPFAWPATFTTSSGFIPSLNTPIPYGTPLCGGPRVMTILAIGSDTRSTGYTWGLSDVMRVIRVDFVTPRVTMLDFPRDMWVEIPYIADNLNGQDREKLNQAYLYGNPGDGFHYWDDPGAGPGLLARTLDLNFGVKVDHYLAVNMKTFVKMVDAVGGIDVTFDKPLPNSNDLALQAGLQHLDGAHALEVARNRVDGVFSRGEYQNLVLCALQKKLTNPEVVTKIPGLIKSFQGSVQTDLTPQMMSQLACLGAQLPRSNITLYSFPSELFTGTRIYDPVFGKKLFIWGVDFNVLRGYVAQFQLGNWPKSPESKVTPETESTSFCK